MELNIENFDKYTEIDENGVLRIKEDITEIDYSISAIIGNNEQVSFNGIGYVDSNSYDDFSWNRFHFLATIDSTYEVKEIKPVNKITGITKIIMPNTVKKIGSYAFGGMESLTDIEFSDKLEEIGNSAFEDCKNMQVVGFSDSIEVIEDEAFLNCEHLIGLYLPPNIKKIGDRAFKKCFCSPYETIMNTNPTGKTNFAGMEFLEYKGEDLKIEPFSVIVDIPETLEYLGEEAFAECDNITYVHFHENTNIYYIRDRTFAACQNLEAIDLPRGLSGISENAFEGCKSITYNSIAVPKVFSFKNIKSAILHSKNRQKSNKVI